MNNTYREAVISQVLKHKTGFKYEHIAKQINDYVEYSVKNEKIKKFYGYLAKNKITFEFSVCWGIPVTRYHILSKKQKYDHLFMNVEDFDFFVTKLNKLKHKITHENNIIIWNILQCKFFVYDFNNYNMKKLLKYYEKEDILTLVYSSSLHFIS